MQVIACNTHRRKPECSSERNETRRPLSGCAQASQFCKSGPMSEIPRGKFIGEKIDGKPSNEAGNKRSLVAELGKGLLFTMLRCFSETMTTLLTAIGLLIAAFGALIAYFQWRSTHQRIVLDLFQRRMEVFKEIEGAAKQSVSSTERADATAAFWRFASARSDARFLFGADVITKLEKRRADLAAIMSFSDITQAHAEWQRIA